MDAPTPREPLNWCCRAPSWGHPWARGPAPQGDAPGAVFLLSSVLSVQRASQEHHFGCKPIITLGASLPKLLIKGSGPCRGNSTCVLVRDTNETGVDISTPGANPSYSQVSLWSLSLCRGLRVCRGSPELLSLSPCCSLTSPSGCPRPFPTDLGTACGCCGQAALGK